MNPKNKPAPGSHPLRQNPETGLLVTREQVKKMTLEEVQHLVYELQAHQIELEMQNEELRQTQRELEVTGKRYAAVYDFSPVGYVTLDDGHSRILEANLTFCHLVGVSRLDILNTKFEQYVIPDDQRAFQRYLDFLRQTPGMHRSDLLTLQHANNFRRVRFEGCLENREPSSKTRVFRIAVEDVTIQEQVESAQDEQRALMAVVMDGVMDAIVTIDESQRIVLFNKAAEDMFGCPASSALKQSIDRFIPKRFRAAHQEHFQQFGRNPKPFRQMGGAREIFGVRTSGEEFPIEATISQVQAKEQGKKLFTVVLRDVTERRHAQEMLKKDQQFITAILDIAGALMVVMNRHGQIIRFNRACERLTGYSFEDVRHKLIWDILQLPKLGVEEVKEYFQAILQGQAPTFQENYWVTKDNIRRWIAWSYAVLRDDQGRVDFVIVTGINLTGQRNAQRALKNEQRFIANVLNTTGALVIILDPQWRILRVNRACEQTVRHAFQDLKGQPFWNLLTPSEEDNEGATEVLESYKTGRFPCTFESAILDKARHLCWIQWNTTASYKKNGDVEYFIVTGTDITRRRQTEQLLQQSKEQLQAILDHSPVSIWLKDLEGRYLKVNRQFERNAGLSEKQILGKTDTQIFPSERASRFWEIDQTILQTRQAHESDEKSDRSDGIHTEHVFKFLLTTPKGKPYALCGIATDITQRKQAETILQEASQRLEIQQQELRSLAAQLLTAQEEERRRISRDLHDDVNQRLALMSLKLQSAQNDLPDMHPVTQMLHELYANVGDLSDDIRRLAYQYHPSILDDLGLGSALRSLCEDFEKWEGISVTCELADRAGRISQAVGTCLYRVAQESLRNVVRHAQASAVHLVLRNEGPDIILSIHDNGKGFEVDGVLSRGLGFVSMRERVRLVGGTLFVESQPGYGTTVKVSIAVNAQS
ncbi:sensor histidine kinase [Candidatus Nitrospira allomarina]|uniref:PAS domain S-box protein n=1 Tax=Candidatus Nitrospira allomarina TaxID=3020900 RepID=A0AA96GF54_9BACT|nr:PAS domain S-box protein [Candidatus Nitrospira allomarina]WNM60037.1 PAS domain S-box protein [Candidatus Nitrospira allomarina]